MSSPPVLILDMFGSFPFVDLAMPLLQPRSCGKILLFVSLSSTIVLVAFPRTQQVLKSRRDFLRRLVNRGFPQWLLR